MLNPAEAQTIVETLVEKAMAAGAQAADCLYAGSQSSSVEVRFGELEHVDRSEGEDIGLRVFLGSRSATASSSDFSAESLAALVERVLAMAAEAPEDPYAGLAPAELLHSGPVADLDLVDPEEPAPDSLRQRALAAETAALGVAGVTNSNGGSAGSSAGCVALATSHGFSGARQSTGRNCAASVVAGEGGRMQRDSAWHSARHDGDLDSAEAIGRLAGERAVARLDPIRPRPGRYPILFDQRVAASLLGHFIAAISGSAVARKASFLMDSLGERIFPEQVTIIDDPLRQRGLRSHAFDGEGLAVARTELIRAGVLTGWIADSAAARQLGIAPTGHASRGSGGPPGTAPSNLFIQPGEASKAQLLSRFPEAILVTELIGQGVNGVNGDYSRGAAGFMVSGGEIGKPVAEITIASNLLAMFATLEPASDLEFRRGIDSPTLLVPEMTVAAA